MCAQTLVAPVDAIDRFATAKKLVAYAGLAPSVRAGGERVEYGRIMTRPVTWPGVLGSVGTGSRTEPGQ